MICLRENHCHFNHGGQIALGKAEAAEMIRIDANDDAVSTKPKLHFDPSPSSGNSGHPRRLREHPIAGTR